MATNDESQLEWLYDYIVQFLKSPGWRVPILEFIDEHCVVFDNEEENKFEYTKLHNSFRAMIDIHLANLCAELSISQELFAKACLKGLHIQKDRRVFEQVIACDNFLSFKKLMIKRNKELEAEALKMLQTMEGPQVTQGMENVFAKQEQSEMEHAIALSMAIEEERKRMALSEDEELQRVLRLSELEHQEWLARQRMKELQEKAQIENLRQQEEAQKRMVDFEALMKAEKAKELEIEAQKTAGKTAAQIEAEKAERALLEAEIREKVLAEMQQANSNSPSTGILTAEAARSGRKSGSLGIGASGGLDIEGSRKTGSSVLGSQSSGSTSIQPGQPGYQIGHEGGSELSSQAIGSTSISPGHPGYKAGHAGLSVLGSQSSGSTNIQPGQPGYQIGLEGGKELSSQAIGSTSIMPGHPGYKAGHAGISAVGSQPIDSTNEEPSQSEVHHRHSGLGITGSQSAGSTSISPSQESHHIPKAGLEQSSSQHGSFTVSGASSASFASNPEESKASRLGIHSSHISAQGAEGSSGKISGPSNTGLSVEGGISAGVTGGLSEEARRKKAAEDEKVEALRRQRSIEQESKGRGERSSKASQEASKPETNLPPLQMRKQFTVSASKGEFSVQHVDTAGTMQQADDLRAQAEEIFKSNALGTEDSSSAKDAESLRARKDRLKKQRDLLLSKKRAEREQELKDYLEAGGPDLSKDKNASISEAELAKRKKLAERIKAASGAN